MERVTPRTMHAALAATVLLFATRWYAASRLGWGDAEALYACYARHPQPVYLDHPGLVGMLARIAGGGDAPTPHAAHMGTAVLATLVPWLAGLAARAVGASPRGATIAALSLLVVPEISIGLFAMTPDLLLICAFYGTVAFAALGLQAIPGSLSSLAWTLAAGMTAGIACDAKANGVLLVVGLVLAYASRQARPHLATAAPYAGLLIALVFLAPVVVDETNRGYPMLRHRLITTQAGSGLSLRNVGALAGGQLLYVTPPVLLAAWSVFRDLLARKRRDAVSWLLFSMTVTGAPLLGLALVSRVAEPHWVAPVYLALPLHLARRAEDLGALISPRLATAALSIGAIVIAAAHAWVLFPMGPRLLGDAYVPRYDLANDLFAWEKTLPTLRRALEEASEPGRPPPIIVGAHWTICAQIHAALPSSVLVGCNGPRGDDFSRWLPKTTWEKAPVLLYVSDDRFVDLEPLAPRERAVDRIWKASVERGGRIVREVRIQRLVAGAAALTTTPARRAPDR